MAKSYNEILPRLFLGGTPPEYDYSSRPDARPSRYPHIDVVFTFHDNASAVTGNTLEVRYPFADSDQVELEQEQLERIKQVAQMAHTVWKDGHKVLLRCQGGLNRSALVTGLVLILDGYSADSAVELIRDRRSPKALFNQKFLEFLFK